ncbi:hypothetical protein INR49_017491 [Caranx melampygus]|nr:hypothetical protein INR49_017491 [Caranx melampygus]
MSVELTAAQDVEMFAPSLSSGQQRELAERLTTFLSQFSHLSDSFIIDFFTEDLWHTLPRSWQPVLQDLTYPQVADLLLDATHGDRSSRSGVSQRVHRGSWSGSGPGPAPGYVKPEEFQENQSQSSLLGHIFRKHVKPKKQHEIRKLGLLVKQLCDQTDCNRVVDVGSGQGHLTRFLSFGLGLSVTAIEADQTLVTMASRFDGQLLWALEKEKQKKTSPRHVAGWVNPKASWESFIQQLSSAESSSETPPTPSGPSKKRLRGSECWRQQQQRGQEVQTQDSTDSDPGPQDSVCEACEETASAGSCRSCLQPHPLVPVAMEMAARQVTQTLS